MAARRDYSALDRLTPEQVREFKFAALAPSPRPRRAEPVSTAPLVALGDSWFDYPLGTDIIDCLRRHHHFTVANHSRAGDTIENMIYGTRFNPRRGYAPLPARLSDALADLDHRSRTPVLLVSGGGNDIAGNEFAQFLEHAESGLGLFRRDHARHVINVVFRRAYSDLIARAALASRRGGRLVQIVSHGYGYPVPDGRGIGLAIGLSFIGPWLRPALAAKRIPVRPEGVAIIRELIDLFNDMLMSLDVEHENFHYVDLRELIARSGPDPWVNELHVRNSVYARIADALAARIREIESAVSPRAARGRARRRRRPS